MKPLHVAFLWHMHQPMYKDAATGKYMLPWVRLHALKGYADIPSLSEKYPAFRQTINFTPSLLTQLEDYIHNPEIKDDFLEVTKKRASELNPDEKIFIIKNFFMNNMERVISIHPRYNELLHKRGLRFHVAESDTYLKRFDSQDFLDLQVLFNLMWFGFSARKNHPRIGELTQKGGKFTEEEKLEVIDYQWKVMNEIIPRLKKLQESKSLELACSPFYHPILPLLCKTTEENIGFPWQEDAKWQIGEGRALFQKFFGIPPQGMWPSEGSVSEATLELFAVSGVKWVATDEEILLHSLDQARREEQIYEPHAVAKNHEPVSIFFRDKALSDLIGFGYHRSDAKDAARDFTQRLIRIQENVSSQPGEHVVSIILDGENPWEFYSESGEPFLNLMIEHLTSDPRLKPVTFSEYLNANPKSKDLKKIFAGSWINHNFDIWAKHPEDLKAWQYLDETRNALLRISPSLSSEIREKAWREIYAAEASDWFWWFGDEFFTETGDIFDYLFRSHLLHVFDLIKKRPPAFLKNSIKDLAKPHAHREPIGLIHPVIDGKVTNYFEWESAGLYQREHSGGAMYEPRQAIEAIYYGFNLSEIFIRLDLSPNMDPEERSNGIVAIHFHGRKEFDIRFPADNARQFEIFEIHDQEIEKAGITAGNICGGNIIELSIPFSALEALEGDSVGFSASLYKNSTKLEECPRSGLIQVIVPGKDYETGNWSA